MSDAARIVAEKSMKIVSLGVQGKSKYFKVDDNAVRASKGLSERQLEILFRIFLVNQNSITILAESMRLSKSTVSIIMNKLINKGYVIRNYPRQDEDKRRVYFNITDKGKELLNAISDAKVAEISENYKRLSENGRKLFDEAMDLLSTMVDEETIKFHELMDKLMNDLQKTNVLHIKGIAALTHIYGPVFKSVFGEENAESGITEKQFKVLVAIHNLKLNTVTKLERFFLTSGSSVSIIVLRMEKAGLLYKEHNKCEEDRRITYIDLTEKGIDILNNLYSSICDKLTEHFRKRTAEEVEKVNIACDKIIQAMTENITWR